MVEVTTPKNPELALSWEDRKKLCVAWQKTNLSRSAFMRQHALPKAFHNWCKKLLPKKTPAKIIAKPLPKIVATKAVISAAMDVNAQWLPIVAPAMPNLKPQVQPLQQQTMELSLVCNGLKLSCSISMEQIITLVKELSHAATIIRQ